MRRSTSILRIAVFLTLGFGFEGLAQNSKISPDLQALLAKSTGNINVIVQYGSSVQSGGGGILAETSPQALTSIVAPVVNQVFSIIDAASLSLTGSAIVNLATQSNVKYISLDRSLTATLDYSTAAVNAPVAWSSGLDGTGVGVAVIDSGIYPHPDLGGPWGLSRIVYRKSFIGGVQNDDFGHGTHVAGIIAGDAKSSSFPGSKHILRGMAPNANLLDLRVLDANGMSNDSVVIAAIQQAVQLKNVFNVRIINLSLGRPIVETCSLDPLCEAVEAAWNSGVVVVVAAGNLGRNGYATVLCPGNSPHAITVGAMKTEETYPRTDDLVASYSSRGPTYIDLTAKPDVVAPGNLVVSLLAPNSTLSQEFPGNIIYPGYYSGPGASGPPEYFRLSGTSMATPIVSGAAALMIEHDPTLTPDTVKARLMKTAYKVFPVFSIATDPTTGQTYLDTYDMFTIGAGYVDVAAALADYEVATKSAQSPAVKYLGGFASLILTPSELWNSSVGWSTNVVWGNSVLEGTGIIWNTPAIWSGSSNWGTAVAWGTSGDQGTAVAWGTSGNGEK
ncbi:MAG: S8 family peptidase [Bryobacteraceae bacterium]|jgi:serine protease AprX